MSANYYIPLDGPVAHGYLDRAVHTPCNLIHQHPDRRRCESYAFPPNFQSNR